MIKFLLTLPFIIFISILLTHVFFIRQTTGIYTSLDDIPYQTYDYAIVFGAGVKLDGTPTDVVKERIDAAIKLYEQNKITKIYVSGDNRHNYQAQSIADYAIKLGVFRDDVVIDKLGIDTHDTCRHFGTDPNIPNETQALLLTQQFHLPRALLMCKDEGVLGTGLAVNELGLLEQRADSTKSLYTTRANRFLREAFLTLLYRVGVYDFFSIDAEKIEENDLDPESTTLSLS